MAKQDYESKLEEIELNNLQKAISEVEAAVAVSTPGTRPIFESFLQNARSRVGTLDKKLKESEKERDSRARDQVVMAQMAESEKALSADEKRTFSGFLEKEFFTKKHFGALEQFYSKSWNRLSASGKDAMSHRVWEGIRRDEYTFGELPKPVREKETDWAYSVLKKRDVLGGKASEIPEQDRGDFIRSYETGKREEAQKILERDSFKKHMFRGAESKDVKQASVEIESDADGKSAGLAIASGGANAPSEGKSQRERDATGDASDLKLDGIKLADAPQRISSDDIPNAKVQQTKGGPSLGG